MVDSEDFGELLRTHLVTRQVYEDQQPSNDKLRAAVPHVSRRQQQQQRSVSERAKLGLHRPGDPPNPQLYRPPAWKSPAQKQEATAVAAVGRKKQRGPPAQALASVDSAPAPTASGVANPSEAAAAAAAKHLQADPTSHGSLAAASGDGTGGVVGAPGSPRGSAGAANHGGSRAESGGGSGRSSSVDIDIYGSRDWDAWPQSEPGGDGVPSDE